MIRETRPTGTQGRLNSNRGVNTKELIEKITSGVIDGVKAMERPEYIPSGAMEPAIPACGIKHGITWIVNLQCNNKGGKSAIGAQIWANIIWENDPVYFDYPLYRDWPFYNSEYDKDGNMTKKGECIKNLRIVGTPENVSDTGPIRTEILKWWPKGRYTCHKAKQSYYSKYYTDTGWFIDVKTFEQSPESFEGPLKSAHWVDEPSKPDLIGAYLSRHSKGGFILFTQTPLNAAPMLDIFEDLRSRRNVKNPIEIVTIKSTLYENSITKGKLNSKGTKRGLMSDDEVDSYVANCPIDQLDARVFGKDSDKQGRIYKKYDDAVHCRDYDWTDPRFKVANCYCAIDPHDKYYPFISWWAVFPPNKYGICNYICYNEWPDINTFHGKFYDETRRDPNHQCNLSYSDFSDIIKIKDMSQFGFHIVNRGIDPKYSKTTFAQQEFMEAKLKFTAPPVEKIAVKRNLIYSLIDYDESLAINEYNEPKAYIMPHCQNMRRMMKRHYWEDNSKAPRGKNLEKESERYKEGPDTFRFFLALLGNREYIPVSQMPGQKESEKIIPIADHHRDVMKGMRDIVI